MTEFTKRPDGLLIPASLASTGLSRRGFLAGTAALGLAAGFGGTLAATDARAQEPKRGGHLKLGLKGGATTDSLDPAAYSGSVSFVIGHLWGDTLVESDPKTGAPLPALAESWEPSADASEWTFKIRGDVSFHDGSKLTVADVVATLKRHADEGSKSGALGLMRSIKTIEEKAGSLVLTLTEGNADLPLLLTDYHLIIQPKGGVDNPASPVGTGPYKLASYEAGLRATFEKNADDWRSDRGFVDSVEIIVMNDTTARIAALSSGQVHFINNIDPKTVPLLKRAPRVEILRTSGKGFYSFLMHCDTAPFDNNDLRLALKYAVDRQAILDRVLGGFGTLGNDYPVNGNYALAPEGIEQRAYDPDKAAFHFKKSGHDRPILLRTSDAAFPGAADAAVLFQESAKKAGIEIEVRREPEDGYWTNVWNVQPFCASYWGGRPTQDSRYSTSYLSTAEWNDTRFKREDFDKLLLQARSELDEAKRKEMYRTMAMTVRDEGGLILPVFNDYVNAASASLKGFVDDIGNDLSNGYVGSRVWFDS
ncbi:ABC transporter substrate-binding protein [Ensifer adhaerens]|jgi:peptide/nickel transport system substrate-binding protein|uniref:ABC transporter substrate-binding protein n=1 Tax=Ensifer adhaerens TaxID=106592 RepID=A0A9Q8Y4D4_ENSAD|nr:MULTISPECIES: ABC transporter substrate-binding protein [Ensifer]KSV71477.1 peptide ABC transporter substrate-binding protein [Sinorhizobium sp. GW3]OWZ94171.1 peptide ABC transporter substrate-binding protein [Sinorhizobium sp. LM21]MBD9592018.1 ABC transporter substrate-binding protein [Ensifer sp. ENS05]MDF8355224.1 ABC transporter substrate-binding protein [Ensifer adhaerens]THA69471.1 ABC transporter substrate-binding protein [Ensifer adhaerens]